jgi:predicted nuclease of predicted toxin-antitoxin system
MKLLLDQNISFRLVAKLDPMFPGSKHIKDFDLTGDNDQEIWDLAAKQDFAIVSKDSDFQSRSLLYGHPPKVIQLRVGNCSTTHIFDVLTKKQDAIKQFLEDSTESLLVLE